VPGLRLLLLAALAAGALIWFAPWLYEHYELSAWSYAVKGVDVSHHQGDIDWQALRAAGVSFAYIKATEGASFRDPRFAGNWRRSRDAGVLRGAYHYFSLCKPGAEQAANFAAATPLDPQSLPHALDVEQMEPCPEGQRVPDPIAEIQAFLDMAEKRFGRRPLIYTTHEFHAAYRLGEHLGAERFWLRSLHRTPGFGGKTWILWQYHNRGRRPGVDGPVDLDAFNGSAADFKKFAWP
jgi:lysozyme